MRRELTGRDVLIVTLAAFGLIIGVNLTLAVKAVSSFPGVETASAYVASQRFQAERSAQQALGWDVALRRMPGGLEIAIHDRDGRPVQPRSLRAVLQRPMRRDADADLALMPAGPGLWRAPTDVDAGNWQLDLRATAADGTAFRLRRPLPAPGPDAVRR